MSEKERAHFLLIHGACHGAWCWYKLVTLLRSNGYKVTALDMAASGVNPKRLEELNSFSDYAEPLMAFMADLPPDDRVILVGHSMGGVTISLAMEKFPQKIAVAVFLTAFTPAPHLPIRTMTEESTSQLRSQYNRRLDSTVDIQHGFENGEDKPPTSLLFGPKFLSTKLYQLSPPEDLALATFLVRPIAPFADANLSEGIALTDENYGAVRRVYIISDKDNVIKEDLQRWMIEKNPVEEVEEIYNSDHMVMLSRPLELCSCLERIAEKFA
ncbi:methyl jasmonate esterase 1-like isoform X1 [Coffea arabica]|uniref:Methyl jasmonate esterase 1-like isoform X1 n=1 Tax=Coffea arabica TaxID=13443 RepID=A0ABM4VAK0_COFAR